ncbi:helix-turn-helix domain-containing protein [Burkholderia sp. LMG 13014]|uniref:helix-turn-helix domain-containing protein n=1 Tax=Burkholderia sp. LMG 13014 TaxID=2709306 RepID=UPI0035A8B529
MRSLREDAGLNQTDLALALGIDQSTVSKFEKGARSCDLLFYLDWCRACGVQPVKALAALAKAGA